VLNLCVGAGSTRDERAPRKNTAVFIMGKRVSGQALVRYVHRLCHMKPRQDINSPYQASNTLGGLSQGRFDEGPSRRKPGPGDYETGPTQLKLLPRYPDGAWIFR
jgi:hypothetical protein